MWHKVCPHLEGQRGDGFDLWSESHKDDLGHRGNGEHREHRQLGVLSHQQRFKGQRFSVATDTMSGYCDDVTTIWLANHPEKKHSEVQFLPTMVLLWTHTESVKLGAHKTTIKLHVQYSTRVCNETRISIPSCVHYVWETNTTWFYQCLFAELCIISRHRLQQCIHIHVHM